MLEMQATQVECDDATLFLVGPEGLVWVQPSIGEPFIVAARNEEEKESAARFVGALLAMGLVPYGLPLNQRATVALFGGSPIRDCHWVPWKEAPLPAGDDDLPSRACVV
ncbi:MAG: hypothetical protein H5T84_07125 [Thermoleophilia bacterium]|nr:hypothetical protein [Thermoleophilia bacterium]